MHHSGGLYRWISDTYPAADMSLRTSGADTVGHSGSNSGDEPRVIGEVDRSSAPIAVYEGAIYFHEDQQYVIKMLDWEQGVASAQATTCGLLYQCVFIDGCAGRRRVLQRDRR